MTTRKTNYDSFFKNKDQRGPAVENRGKTHKKAPFFPAKEGFDLTQALDNGTISTNTEIVAIEQDKDVAEYLDEKFGKLFRKFQVVNKKFCDIDLSQYFSKGEIDYFPFDICGNFTIQNAYRFWKHSDLFSKKARVPITISALNRNRDDEFFLHVRKGAWGNLTEDDIITWFNSYIKDNNTETSNLFSVGGKLLSHIAHQVFLICHCMEGVEVEIKRLNVYRNTDQSNMASYMVFLDTVFHKKSGVVNKRRCFDFSRTLSSLEYVCPQIHSRVVKKVRRVNTSKVRVKPTYREICKITCRKDLDLRGKRAYITRVAKKEAKSMKTTVESRLKAIRGGISKQLTHMGM
jgi:hypothetical protein